MHIVLFFFTCFLCAFLTAYGSTNQPSQSNGNYCALNDVCKNLRSVQEKQKAVEKKVNKHDEALACGICSEVSEGCKKFSISAVVHCTSAIQYRGESHFKLEAFSSDKKDMCRTLGKSIRESASYSATVDLLNQAGWAGIDSGHPGLLYNAVDENNFDFVYFRPHSASGCYQTGYMSKGRLNFLQSKSCPSGPPRGGVWFEVAITVNGQDVQIILNKELVTTVKAHFPPMAWGGVFTFHGYQNVVLFRNFQLVPQLYVTQGCAATSDWSDYSMLDANHGTWPQDGFCRAMFVKEGGVEEFQVTVELFNFIGVHGVNSGDLGVLFNAQDENNFDFVYFRPHSVGGCFQTGYVFKGQPKFDGSKTGPCPHGPPKGATWFQLQVGITSSGKAKVFINEALVTSWTSRYPIKSRGGVLVANGYQNVVYLRNFRLE